jgi:putative membrane protein
MRNIWKIFTGDIHSLVTHFFALLVAVAITLLPSLYAWLNIYSNWDPYGNTGNISIAVASLDEGCTTDEGEEVNMGREIIDDLRRSTSIDWVVLESAEEAVDGVNAGKYYAAVVFDGKFSYNMYHMLSHQTGKPTITYYENYKKNAVATKITDTAASTLQTSVSERYLDVLVGHIFGQANVLAEKLEQADPGGSARELLGETRQLLASCRATLEVFGNVDLPEGGDGESGALDRAIAALDTEEAPLDTVAELDGKLLGALDAVREALGEVRAAVTDYESADNSEALLQRVDAAADKAARVTGEAAEVAGAWSERLSQSDLDAAQKAAADAAALGDKLSDLRDRLAELPSLVGDRQALSEAADGCLTAAEEAEQAVRGTLVPTLSDLSAHITETAGRVRTDLEGFRGAAEDVSALLAQADVTASSLRSGMAQITDAVTRADERLAALLTRLDESDAQTYLNTLTELLGGDAQTYGAYFSQVVQTKVETVYPVENYGSAMAPFYTVLAVWVGGVILVAVLRTGVRREDLPALRPAEQFFGRYLLFLLLSQIQTAVIITGDLLLLHVQCLYPGRLYLVGVLTSLTFSLLIYALTIAFGDVGKAIVVVIMVLQIAGSSGTFPIELLPEIYQKIYRFFPFPYAIDAMRECICGLYGTTYRDMLLRLLIFAGAGLVIGLLVRRPFIGINRFMEERLEETKLF